jgi:UPF0176 protein
MKAKSLPLVNQFNKTTLEQEIERETFNRITVSFYRYFHIENPPQFRDELFIQWNLLGIKGRTYLAKEGINAQISVPETHWDEFKTQLYDIPGLYNTRLNVAVQSNKKAFLKLIVRIRPKIVADGIDDPSFNPANCGQHLNAEAFNALLENPETVVVDMRNHYESEVGHFIRAIKPDVDTFRDSLPIIANMLETHKDKPVLMYCTGGIRCEKASAFMKYKGFNQVFQLEGGIIEYTRQVREQKLPMKFIGKNFVFDQRLGERITDDIIAQCHQCGTPCDDHTNCMNESCHLLFIQCQNCKEKHQNCCSENCTSIVALPEKERKNLRKGKIATRNVFRKGRFGHTPGNTYVPVFPK